VDVLVSGHTHVHSTVEFDGRCYVNPGSMTGAYTPLARAPGGGVAPPPPPSFMLMAIHEARIDFFTYELTPEGKLKITKATHNKATRS
jgi:vacuolar protein sorting-associated protein 29